MLRALLLDTDKRSEQLLAELDSLRSRLPTDVEPHRQRWAEAVRRFRSVVEDLLQDPDLGNPLLASNYYIAYKSVMQFLFEVESGPLVALGRFQDDDLFVTRVLARISNEIGFPYLPPLGTAGSAQFYGALPAMDLVMTPPLEAAHLLGLADLYHELAHFVLRRHGKELLVPFQETIDRVFDEFARDLQRRNATSQEVANAETWRALWKRSWQEEFAADMIATYWVGPSFGWANVRLCTNMSEALFIGGVSHPADAARHRGVELMLQRLGDGEAAKRIDVWWQELVVLSRDLRPNDFDLTYPPELLKELCEFLAEECPALGLTPWPRQAPSHNPHIGNLLNQAWEEFVSTPETFGEFERAAVKELKNHLGLA